MSTRRTWAPSRKATHHPSEVLTATTRWWIKGERPDLAATEWYPRPAARLISAQLFLSSGFTRRRGAERGSRCTPWRQAHSLLPTPRAPEDLRERLVE